MSDVVERIYQAPLRAYTTLRAGGPAEQLAFAEDVEQLAELAFESQKSGTRLTLLGRGSNVLPSDAGIAGLTVINRATRIRVAKSGEIVADTGCDFQELFLKTAQAGLRGLEYAVGIPGTLGGALVSNAGAYRSNVSEFLTGLEIVFKGERAWVTPEWMQFSYRNSILRRTDAPSAVVLRISMTLPAGERQRIYDEAREYQRQRIGKQPPSASAGSFFKNVNDHTLAETLDLLPPAMRAAGVIPAGYLIEAAGLKGFRIGGAMLGRRHANFMLNVGGASATEIRNVAEHTKAVVRDRFGVVLEEEVLYLGDWSRYCPPAR